MVDRNGRTVNKTSYRMNFEQRVFNEIIRISHILK